MTHAERAKNNFLNGYNCAQSVVLAFADEIDVPEKILLAAAMLLGGGLGRLRETCGAVSGGAVALGLLFPECPKAEMYALVQELAHAFAAKNGTINCGQLLRGAGLPAETVPHPEERTQEYYRKRPCPELIFDAAGIVADICRRRGRILSC